MTPAAAAAVLLVVAAVVAGGGRPGATVRRLRRVTAVSSATGGAAVSTSRGASVRAGRSARPVLLAAVRRRGPAVVVVTSVVSLLAGSGLLALLVLAGGAVLVLPGRLAAVGEARRDAELERALAPVADLLATCLDAGASLADAVALVAEAEGGVAGARLLPVVRALRLGSNPDDAIGTGWPGDPWQPLWRAVALAARNGSELAPTLVGVADDARGRQRWAGEAAARRAGVRAVAPLAVCFLPAFLLGGVVPTVAGVAGSVLAGLR